MMLVTVGNATQGFRRLLDAVEALAVRGVFGQEPIVVQSGQTSGFTSERCVVRPFLPPDDFERAVQEADLIISHAGAGTLIHVLGAGKTPVVMPRRRVYGEHVDEHQLEITRALAATGRIVPAYETIELEAAVSEARAITARSDADRELRGQSSRMVDLVAQTLKALIGEPAR